eukprot:TRINITY_DN893_c0_g1_i2.p1 TRINITY_DN893_c0_g1~~TRINITY_DN893_c0_g1_i2.p1  ORF type:complete len:547 (+),score=97.40 TRINITY_DN893_c0_g1_i2:68-1642(+)
MAAAAQTPRVLVLGGAGTFGSRIAGALCGKPGVAVVLGGRREAPLRALKAELESANTAHNGVRAAHPVGVVQVDAHQPGQLARVLAEHGIRVVVHTAGPFQAQGYGVARVCAQAGVHYLDLADDRAYVTGFAAALQPAAAAAGVAMISGCSTTPGVTSAVVDRFQPEFARLDSVSIAISPGNQLPRGVATVASIASYCGKPFTQIRRGRAEEIIGWTGMQWEGMYGLGPRLVAYCNVPDLELLPQRYPSLAAPGADGVDLRAGTELSVFVRLLNLGARWLPGIDYARHAPLMAQLSLLLLWAGSDDGGMKVTMRGQGQRGEQHEVVWSMFAGGGHGPQTPCTPAVILAERAAAGRLQPGARACLGEISEADVQAATAGLGYNFLFHVARRSGGDLDSTERRPAAASPLQLEGAFSAGVADELPDLMRRFHCPRPDETAARVRGCFDIRRPGGWLAGAVATLGGLPPAMQRAPTVAESSGGRWTRRFGDARLQSALTLEDGLVHEVFRTPIGLRARFAFLLVLCY